MRFLRLDAVVWLLAIPALVCVWYLHRANRQRFRRQASLLIHLEDLSQLSSWRRDAISLTAGVVAVVALVAAIGRPQLSFERRDPQYEQEDLVIVVDRSVSMRADDVRPSRFSRAIREIKAFLLAKPDAIDRVALVGFAESSVVLSPFTRDLTSLIFYLDWLEEDKEPRFGTNIGTALASARELATKDRHPTRKIFLIISDGEDQGAELAAELVAARGQRIPVYTIGIGSEDAVVIPVNDPVGRPTFLKDEKGGLLRTRLDESTLRRIATQTGGRYVRSINGNELEPAMRAAVDRERRVIDWKTEAGYHDIYRECLFVAGIAVFVLLFAL